MLKCLLALTLFACGSTVETPEPMALAPVLPDAVIYFGASSCLGTETDAAPAGMPSNAAQLWQTVPGSAVDADSFGPLAVLPSGAHGAELQLGLNMPGLAIVKVAHISTALDEWLPGAPFGDALAGEVAEAAASLPPSRWHLVTLIGGDEARAPSEEPALAWASNFAAIRAELAGVVGQPLSATVVQIYARIPGGTWIATVRAQQAAVADMLIDIDDLPHVGNLHPTGASQNAIGDRLAAVLTQ